MGDTRFDKALSKRDKIIRSAVHVTGCDGRVTIRVLIDNPIKKYNNFSKICALDIA